MVNLDCPFEPTYAARVLIIMTDTGLGLQRVARVPATSAERARQRIVAGLSMIGTVTLLSEPVIEGGQRMLSLKERA